MASGLPKRAATLSCVFVGYVDSGKSTLVGKLRYYCGQETRRRLEDTRALASETGKASFTYAFLCDSSEHERARGITIQQRPFLIFDAEETKDPFTLVAVDTPGVGGSTLRLWR